MGFLDKKKRIIDTYVTPYGRKKLSSSGLGISYVALTDISALYLSESNNTVDGEFSGLILESKSSFKDQIFFSTLEPGSGASFGDYFVGSDGELYESSTTTIVTGNEFISAAGEIPDVSFQNLIDKKYLKNKSDERYDDFVIDKSVIDFHITNNSPIKRTDVKEINVDTAEPFFFDKFISSADQYKFLPPVIPADQSQTTVKQLGEYTDLNQKDIKTFKDVLDVIGEAKYHDINFEETSRDSNIVLQMFSSNPASSTLQKLDTLDFGEYFDDGKFKKVIFAGKVFYDSYDYPTYVNIFTIVMEE